MDKVRPAREDIKSPPCTTSKNSLAIRHCVCRYIYMYVFRDFFGNFGKGP